MHIDEAQTDRVREQVMLEMLDKVWAEKANHPGKKSVERTTDSDE